MVLYWKGDFFSSFTMQLFGASFNSSFDFEFFLCAGDAVFDASQYAFFGKDSVEEVELGGLDEEDAPVGFDEEEFLYDREQVKPFSSLIFMTIALEQLFYYFWELNVFI